MKTKIIIVCLFLMLFFIMALVSIDIFTFDETILEIKLDKNPECKWQHKIEDENVVIYDKKYDFDEENLIYIFKGNKKGTSKIIFSCVYRDDPLIEEKEFVVKVDNNKKISLDEKEDTSEKE